MNIFNHECNADGWIIDKPIQEENESKDKAELFFFIKRDDERLSYIEQKANENVLNNINDERYLGSSNRCLIMIPD